MPAPEGPITPTLHTITPHANITVMMMMTMMMMMMTAMITMMMMMMMMMMMTATTRLEKSAHSKTRTRLSRPHHIHHATDFDKCEPHGHDTLTTLTATSRRPKPLHPYACSTQQQRQQQHSQLAWPNNSRDFMQHSPLCSRRRRADYCSQPKPLVPGRVHWHIVRYLLKPNANGIRVHDQCRKVGEWRSNVHGRRDAHCTATCSHQ